MHKLQSVDELTYSALERFWSYVDRREGCWTWTGAKDVYGYGVFFYQKKKSYRAHRISWIIAHGSIIPGKLVCHHCDNPSCVLPSHLFLGTPKDNKADQIRKGRFVKNTHCKKGHPLVDGNIAISRNKRGTYRLCRICVRANNRVQYQKRKSPIKP